MSDGTFAAAPEARTTEAKPSVLRRLFPWLMSALALAFVVWMVPFRDRCTDAGCDPGLLSTLRSTNATALAFLFAFYMLGTLVWAARWRTLLGVAGVRVSLMQAWRVLLEAQAGGILLPGGVAGDALRIAYVRRHAPDVDLAKIIASIVADRVIGLVTLASIATGAALGFGARDMGPALPVLGAIPVFAVMGWLVLRRPALLQSSFVQSGVLSRYLRPVLEYASAPGGGKVLFKGFLLSLVVSFMQLLIVRGFIAAMGVTPSSEAWVYVGTTFGMIAGAVPALPGAWGTADAAYVFFLARAGISAPAAAAACLLYRVFWYASAIIGALLALRRPSK